MDAKHCSGQEIFITDQTKFATPKFVFENSGASQILFGASHAVLETVGSVTGTSIGTFVTTEIYVAELY